MKTLKLTLLLCFVSAISFANISNKEKSALIALCDATNGDNWTDNTDWKVTNTPCSWYGVTCSDGNVTGLYLEDNQLIGIIPSELGNFTNLQGLGLHENQLTGSIPTELSNLVNLQGLYLANNQLTGSIPNLGTLTSL